MWCGFILLTTFVDDDEDEGDDEDESDGHDSDTEYKHARPRCKRRSEATSWRSRKIQLEPCPDMVLMEHNFRSKSYNLNDFSSFLVKISNWVPKQLDSSFFLGSSISTRFTVNNLSSNDEEEVNVLERFSGGFINGSPVMFCGGPVTAMAWCPTDKGVQVLAVVTKLDFSPSSLGEEGGGKGLIQFWRMGGLEMEGGGKPPVFLFGIEHSYGSVRGVEWCPSLRREEGRLGLLAAACGDRSVRAWAIPSLNSMRDEGLIYEKEADMSLVLGEEVVEQCMALSW